MGGSLFGLGWSCNDGCYQHKKEVGDDEVKEVCSDFDFFEKFSTVSQKENHKKGDDEVKDLPSEWVEHEYSTKKRLAV